MKRIVEITALLLVLAYGTYLLIAVLAHSDRHWDFKTYHGAARTALMGLDPYSAADMRTGCEDYTRMPFVYTPASLVFFLPFAKMPLASGYVVWAVVKIASLVLLLGIWLKYFVAREQRVWFLLFAIVGLNGALYMDMWVGNVTVIEQCLLWMAFLAFVRGRAATCALLICAASVFKVTPLFFLVLVPLATTDRKALLRAAGAVVVAAVASVGVVLVISPRLMSGFFHNAGGLLADIPSDRGVLNPSTLAFARDVAERVLHTSASQGAALVLYTVIVAAVCGVSVWAASRIVKSIEDPAARRLLLVVLVCLAYAIILPRFKNYSYVLLLVPVFATLMRASSNIRPQYLLLALAVLSTGANSWLPGVRAGYAFLWDYIALVVAFGAWALLVSQALASPVRCIDSASAPSA